MGEQSQYKLIIEDEEGRRSVVPVDLGEISIGRLDGNTIRLKERNVSRHHARLRKEGDTVIAEDLDSYNGLWVNGGRIDGQQALREGDLLRIGDFYLELRGEGHNAQREETTQRTLLHPDTQPGFDDFQSVDEPTESGVGPIVVEPTQIIDPAEEDGLNDDVHTSIIHAPDEEDLGGAPSVLTGARAKVICVSTQYAGREFEITKAEVILGRTDDNDIAIDHRSVSRQHAKITVSGRRYRVVDLGSANGTLVNGEPYAQTELKRGDLIELGHVKLRFVPPGETYALTAEELAAVQGLRKRRWSPLALWGATGLAIVLAVMAGWMALGGGGERAAGADAAAIPPLVMPHDVAAGSGEAERLMVQVQGAMAQHQWKRAQTFANAVLALDPSREDALAALRQVDTETRAQHSVEAASAATGQNLWADAWNALQEVPKESTFFPQAMTMMGQVRPALVTERLNECRAAVKAEDWDEATLQLEEIVGLDATRKEIPELRGVIEDGRKRRLADKHGVSKPAHPKGAKATRLSGQPPPPPAKIPDDPKILYGDGAKALGKGEFTRAIDAFNRCVQADKAFGLCYRGLGIAYAKIGNGPKAARYYKLYLKADPNTPEAPAVRKLLQQYEGPQ